MKIATSHTGFSLPYTFTFYKGHSSEQFMMFMADLWLCMKHNKPHQHPQYKTLKQNWYDKYRRAQLDATEPVDIPLPFPLSVQVSAPVLNCNTPSYSYVEFSEFTRNFCTFKNHTRGGALASTLVLDESSAPRALQAGDYEATVKIITQREFWGTDTSINRTFYDTDLTIPIEMQITLHKFVEPAPQVATSGVATQLSRYFPDSVTALIKDFKETFNISN